MLTALGQVLTLLQLLLSQVAGNKPSAVSVHSISKVLKSHTRLAAFPSEQLLLIDKAPLLHQPMPQWYIGSRRNGLSCAVLRSAGIEATRFWA